MIAGLAVVANKRKIVLFMLAILSRPFSPVIGLTACLRRRIFHRAVVEWICAAETTDVA